MAKEPTKPKYEQLHYSVHPAVFEKFPGFARGVVLLYEVSNGPSPEPLVELLRTEEEGLRQRLSLETLTEEPRIRSWREAFRRLGVKPSEYRPSIEALVRRVLRGDPLPAINALVDISNLVSLRYLVPAGGHAIDEIREDITLRPADGMEEFVALGEEKLEHPDPGEIIFVEGRTVLTRRWVWRQSRHTLTLPESRTVEVNIDALPPVSIHEVETVAQDIVKLAGKFCGGHARVEILSAQNPRISLGEGQDQTIA